MSGAELEGMKFSRLKTTGAFKKIIGQPYDPFYIMVYGSRYNGKSSIALILANDLLSVKDNILYISDEEGISGALQEKSDRLGISKCINYAYEYSEELIKGFDVVVIDSIQTAGLTKDDFKILKKKYPKTSFIMVFKANRDGTAKGGTDWEHDVDVIIQAIERKAHVEKNRFAEVSKEAKDVKVF